MRGRPVLTTNSSEVSGILPRTGLPSTKTSTAGPEAAKIAGGSLRTGTAGAWAGFGVLATTRCSEIDVVCGRKACNVRAASSEAAESSEGKLVLRILMFASRTMCVSLSTRVSDRRLTAPTMGFAPAFGVSEIAIRHSSSLKSFQLSTWGW
jgi:hypothetical protein